MSKFSQIMNIIRGVKDTEDINGAWGIAFDSLSGENVSIRSASQIATVYNCVNVLAETLGSIPLKVYRRKKGGEKEEIENGLTKTLAMPNSRQNSFDFFEDCVWSLALRGKFFAYISKVMDKMELLTLSPDLVTVHQKDDWTLEFQYQGQTFGSDKILYIQTHGGDSIITSQAKTLGQAQVYTKYSSSYFRNNGQPGVVLSRKKDFTSDEDFLKFKRQWDACHTGAFNANSVAILTGDTELKTIPISNQDSQFLETEKYTDSQICGMFRVPPHMVGYLDKATFSNIENLAQQFSRFTMTPWCKRVELALTLQLAKLYGDDLFCEFNLDGLERGSIETRYKAYSTGRNSGFLSVNEIRKKENMDPIENGDVYLIPKNMGVAGSKETNK